MDSLIPASQFKDFFFVWHPGFAEPHPISYPVEDTRAVEEVESEDEEDEEDEEDDEEVAIDEAFRYNPLLSTEEIVRRFLDLQCKNNSERYSYLTSQIKHFLNSNREEGRANSARRSFAFLDDRNDKSVSRASPGGNFRKPLGALNAQKLHRALLRPRVRTVDQTQSANTGTEAVAETDQEDEEECDAERRLIYLTDVTNDFVLAIISTISRTQAVFFSNFLYRHLAFKTLLSVDIPSMGFKAFALEFHIPYYAWRHINNDDEDQRQRTDGRQLRRAYKVVYLENDDDTKSTDSVFDCIYEAQISVLVTGIDDRFWTAYCFVDVYFKDDGHTERVKYYNASKDDPHSCGKFPLDPPIWNPREYFLRALVGRMEQVKQEWNNAVFQFLHKIEPVAERIAEEQADKMAEESISKGFSDENNITRKTGFKETVGMLRRLTNLLSTTTRAWQVFRDGELRYFYAADSQTLAMPKWSVYLAAIDKDIKELVELKNLLQYQTDMFENVASSFATLETLEVAKITSQQNEFVRALTIITIFYLPPSLASAIFSMQTSILPDTMRSIDYLYTLVGLIVATAALVANLGRIEKLWKIFTDAPGTYWNQAKNLWSSRVRMGLHRENQPGNPGVVEMELEEQELIRNNRIDPV